MRIERHVKTFTIVLFITLAQSAISSPYLYWTDVTSDDVMRSDRDGTGASSLVDLGTETPSGISVTANYIYWVNRGPDTIQRSDLDGNNVTTIITGLTSPRDLVVSDQYIFWTDSTDDAVRRSNLDGSGIIDIANSADAVNSPYGITLLNDTLYWAETQTDTIRSADINGNNVQAVYTDAGNNPYGITAAGNYIYYTDTTRDAVRRIELDGSNPTDLITGLATPRGIVTDDTNIYFTDTGSGLEGIYKATLTGGGLTKIVDTGGDDPYYIAIPEPATMGFIGLIGIGTLIARRFFI